MLSTTNFKTTKDFGMISYGNPIHAHPKIYGVAMSRVREIALRRQGSIFLYLPENDRLNRAAITANGNPNRVKIVARP